MYFQEIEGAEYEEKNNRHMCFSNDGFLDIYRVR